jgi:hypothetical protein
MVAFMGQVVAAIHNAWLQIPPGIRVALSFSAAVLVAAAIGLVQAFNWILPGSLIDAKAEVIAFLTYAVPVLAILATQLVRSKIAPAIVAWFLSTFGYTLPQSYGLTGLPRRNAWVKAA